MRIRIERMGNQLRDILSECFTGDQLRDPALDGVSITYVRISADLQIAKVYYRIYDDNKVEDAKKGLDRCKGFLKKYVAMNMEIRRIPELIFYYDESVEVGARIENLLQKIKED